MLVRDEDRPVQNTEPEPVHNLQPSTTVIVSPGHPTNEQEFNQVISNPDNAPIVEDTTVLPSTQATVAKGGEPVFTQTELKQTKTFDDKSYRGDEAGTSSANAELNAMGLPDSYSDTVKDSEGNYYRRSMRTGEWELIDRGEKLQLLSRGLQERSWVGIALSANRIVAGARPRVKPPHKPASCHGPSPGAM
jgi:hypothetical protein